MYDVFFMKYFDKIFYQNKNDERYVYKFFYIK